MTVPERIGCRFARVNPRPGRRLERRANREARLHRSIIVARKAKIAEFEKKLIDP